MARKSWRSFEGCLGDSDAPCHGVEGAGEQKPGKPDSVTTPLLPIGLISPCMADRILVAYASPRGSTAEIAQAVRKELKAAGYMVDIGEMKAVLSLEGYVAVVIGGPLYVGKLVGEMRAFLKHHQNALLKVPVAAFCVGIAPVSKNPEEKDTAMATFHAAVSPVNPVDEVLFAGKVDPGKLPFAQKWMWKKVQGPTGDFRDWDAIGAWAQGLPRKLALRTPRTP